MQGKSNVEDDFWNRVDYSSGCWTWPGAKFERGYGAFKYNGKQWRTHRLAWVFVNGPIPEGLQVNHHCDNPACVRPDHLYLGDQKQNRQDAVRRGRTATGRRNGMHTHPASRVIGERHGGSKIPDHLRVEICKRYAHGGITLAALGKEHGVAQQTIWSIVHSRNWAMQEGTT